jgi:hypothetical protein
VNPQQIDAQVPPVWTGNLDDDCTARWAGLTLRAEWMNDDVWFWCVYDDATGDQVCSSNRSEHECRSGSAARAAAEHAARYWLGLETRG